MMWWMAGMMAMQAAPTAATPSSQAFDVQCMVVSQQAASQIKDSTLALATQMATIFYMGRIDSQLTEAELLREAEAASVALAGQPLGPLLTACGDYMKQRGQRLERIGSDIVAREQSRQTR